MSNRTTRPWNEIGWDPQTSCAMFNGPHGFVRVRLPQREAEAIAEAFGIDFFVSIPGTNLRPDTRLSALTDAEVDAAVFLFEAHEEGDLSDRMSDPELSALDKFREEQQRRWAGRAG